MIENIDLFDEPRVHICIGKKSDLPLLQEAAATDGRVTWTVPRAVSPEDIVVFALPPIDGSFVAMGFVLSAPKKGSKHKYRAQIGEISHLPLEVSIEEVAEAIPEWEFLNDVNSCATVPDEIVDEFMELVMSGESTSSGYEGLFAPEDMLDARSTTISSILLRQGNPAFRDVLLSAYENRCALTDCDEPRCLDAAHLVNYKETDLNHPSNGLLLRTDLHTLLDLWAISIDPDTMTVLISHTLKGTSYENLSGQKPRLPADKSLWPSRENLEWHHGRFLEMEEELASLTD